MAGPDRGGVVAFGAVCLEGSAFVEGALDSAALVTGALMVDALGCAAGSGTTLDCVAAVGADLGSSVDGPEGDMPGAVFPGAAWTGAAFVVGAALDDSSFAAGLVGAAEVGAALAVAVFAVAALTVGCLVVAPLPAPVDDVAASAADAADLLLTVEAPSGPEGATDGLAGQGTLVTEEAGTVLAAVPIPLAAASAGGGPRVSTVDAWFAGGAARAPAPDAAGGPVPGDEDTDEGASAAVVFLGAALSAVDDTAGEGGASETTFVNGRLGTDVDADACGRGACCAFFPCTADAAAAAAAMLCRGVVEMPGGPAGVVREADTSDDFWADTWPDCSPDGETTGMASDEDAMVGVTPACPVEAANDTAGRSSWAVCCSSCLSSAALSATVSTPADAGAAAAGVADGAAGVATVAGEPAVKLEVDSVTPSGETIGNALDAPPLPPPKPPPRDGGSDARAGCGDAFVPNDPVDGVTGAEVVTGVVAGSGDGFVGGCDVFVEGAALLRSMASCVVGSTMVSARRSLFTGGAAGCGAAAPGCGTPYIIGCW